jgi:hypothetical protein
MTRPFEDPSELLPEDDERNRPSLVTTLILLLMVLALLTSLLWPLIWRTVVRHAVPPTPTPPFLQEACIF